MEEAENKTTDTKMVDISPPPVEEGNDHRDIISDEALSTTIDVLSKLAEVLRTQFTIAPNLFSKLTKLKTKFGISCFKEGVSTALKSRYHPVSCVSYLVFVLAFLENLRFGLQFGLARKRNLVV